MPVGPAAPYTDPRWKSGGRAAPGRSGALGPASETSGGGTGSCRDLQPPGRPPCGAAAGRPCRAPGAGAAAAPAPHALRPGCRFARCRFAHASAEVALVSGWEDGEPFCATICSTDVGLQFCRRCPEELAARVLATGRAAHGSCQAGGTLLGFPAPRGSRTTAAILRVGPPNQRDAAAVSDRTRVAPGALRRAAREAPPPDGRAALAAARVLRDPVRLFEWQIQQRTRGSDRRRTATAALAQMVATSEEFYELYRDSQRQRRELERNQRRLDRLARQTLQASDLERARIAHQIHDTAAQSMVSAFRFLDAARAYAQGHPGESVDEYLESASERLVTAIKEVRAVLADLMPPGLEELGLAHAIRSRMNALTAESGIEHVARGRAAPARRLGGAGSLRHDDRGADERRSPLPSQTVRVELRVAQGSRRSDDPGRRPRLRSGRRGAPSGRRRAGPAGHHPPVALAGRLGFDPESHRLGYASQDLDTNRSTHRVSGGLRCSRQRRCPSRTERRR